jgi:hypothetical protein
MEFALNAGCRNWRTPDESLYYPPPMVDVAASRRSAIERWEMIKSIRKSQR